MLVNLISFYYLYSCRISFKTGETSEEEITRGLVLLSTETWRAHHLLPVTLLDMADHSHHFLPITIVLLMIITNLGEITLQTIKIVVEETSLLITKIVIGVTILLTIKIILIEVVALLTSITILAEEVTLQIITATRAISSIVLQTIAIIPE